MEIVTSGLGGLLVLALDIYAIYSVLSSTRGAVVKILWSVLILALPIAGFIIWLIAGPRAHDALN